MVKRVSSRTTIKKSVVDMSVDWVMNSAVGVVSDDKFAVDRNLSLSKHLGGVDQSPLYMHVMFWFPFNLNPSLQIGGGFLHQI